MKVSDEIGWLSFVLLANIEYFSVGIRKNGPKDQGLS